MPFLGNNSSFQENETISILPSEEVIEKRTLLHVFVERRRRDNQTNNLNLLFLQEKTKKKKRWEIKEERERALFVIVFSLCLADFFAHIFFKSKIYVEKRYVYNSRFQYLLVYHYAPVLQNLWFWQNLGIIWEVNT